MQILSISLASLFASVLSVTITMIVVGLDGAMHELNPVARHLMALNLPIGLIVLLAERLLVIGLVQWLAMRDERLGALVYAVCIVNMLDAANNLIVLYRV